MPDVGNSPSYRRADLCTRATRSGDKFGAGKLLALLKDSLGPYTTRLEYDLPKRELLKYYSSQKRGLGQSAHRKNITRHGKRANQSYNPMGRQL